MTLEEYRKKQAESKKQVEVQRRAAGEGVDDSQWKNTVVLKKEEEVDVCGTAWVWAVCLSADSDDL